MRYTSNAITATVPWLVLAAALLAELALVGRWNYVVFHSLIELFSVGVAMALFLIAWNIRRRMDNDFLLFIALAYAATGLLDLFHSLAYPGMGAIPGVTMDPPTQLWIAARYFQALSLLIAPLWLTRRLPLKTVLAGLALIDAFVLLSVFRPWAWLPAFPACHLGARGLTPFKVVSEYIISGILLVAVGLLWRRRSRLDEAVFRYMVIALFVTMASEIAFTSYISVRTPSNLIGHLLKAVAMYLTYKALIEAGLQRPYDVLFRNLSDSERRFRTLTLATFEGIAISENGRLVDCNDQLARMLGYTSQELVGREVTSLVHRDDRELVLSKVRLGTESHVEHRLLRKDGSSIVVEAHGQTTADPSRPLRFTAVRDITERKAAEQALSESRERLDLALASSGMATFEWDIVKNQRTWDDNVHGLLGTKPETFNGTAEEFFQVMPPDDQRTVRAALVRAIETGAYEVEYRAVWPDGSIHHIAARGRVHRDNAGRAVRMAGICWDITRQKQAEEALAAARISAERARETAEAANNAKDHFLAVLSHELRTPLNPALMAATILEHSPQLPPDLREDVAVIRRNVELEARLIDDMLDLTRIARGKLTLNRRHIDACEVIRHAVQICHGDAVEKSLQLECNLPAHPIYVNGDSARLQQVFWNLLKNAIKFTPDHGRILLTAALTEPGWLRVQIADSGKGIEHEVLPRIFDAFEQGSVHVTRRYGGLGLGLAICKGLVAVHEGSIHAASEGPGKGATFTVELPPATQADMSSIAAETPPAAAPEPSSDTGCHILLVEDHESTAWLTARLLRSFGHRVTTADCVKCAIEEFDKTPFDLVISDLGLPDGSGRDLLRQLLARKPVKAIALSGYGMDGDIQESARVGFQEHLVKPVNARQLEDAISRVMGATRG